MRLLVLLLLFIFPAALAQGANRVDNSSFFKKTWQEFSEICNDAAELAGNQNRNSRSVLEILTLRQPRYARLIEDARETLGNSAASDLFEEIDSLRQQNKDLEDKMLDLSRKRISAPESSYNPFADTKERIDKKLREIPEKIASNKAAIEELKLRIIDLLHGEGLDLSQQELDYFLISAEGDEILKLMTMAANIRKIQLVIENELGASSGNLNLARMYAGMYLVCLDAWDSAHEKAIANINLYREKLGQIGKEATARLDEARKLKKDASAEDLSNIDANIKINAKTLEAAEMYESLLTRRNSSLNASRSRLSGKLRLARNTYNTLTNGASLISLVNSGSNEYLMVMNFEMPELKTIYDKGMISAFSDLSDRMRTEN